MAGRYGADQLSFALLIAALALNLIASLSGVIYLSSLSAILIIFGIFRMISRNLEKRRGENMVFMKHWNKVKNFFRRQKDKMRQSRDFRFFKCPSCKNNLRSV